MKNRDFKDSRLIDAFSYIDPKYIAEVADSLKLTNKNAPSPASKRRNWRHIAALAACVLLLGALIPMITYVLRNFGDIAAWLPENTTEESAPLTEPETTEEETTSEPQTTACTHPCMVTCEVIPNCTETYTIYSWCSDCDYTENTIMPPYGHRFVNGICEICGATDECKHSLFTATENVPTCTDSATVNYQCSSCGHTWSEVLPALGHNFVNNICTRCGVEIEYDGSRGLEYKISNDGTYAILVGIGTCTDKDIVTATTYNGLPVTSVDYSFSKISNVTSITLSDSVITIGGIDNMPDLVKVYLSKSVAGVNPESLIGCPKLEIIEVDKDNEKYYSAGNCLIEKATKTIVHGCKGSVIPTDGSVTVIGEFAFHGCNWLTELTIPEGIERISSYAFAGCDSLRNVYLPDSLITLGYGVFYHSSALETVRIGKNLETIGSAVFDGCKNLNNLFLPKTLKRMGEMVFMECKALASVSFEGTRAEFMAIEKVELWDSGSTVSVIHCTDGDLELYEHDGSRGLLYVHYGAYAQLAGIGTCTDKDIVIASTYNGVPVVIIEDGVFRNNKNIRSVTIPDKVHYIGKNAFAFCTSLESVALPANLKTLGEGAFNGCSALKSINLPVGITEIDSYTFSECSSLTEIVIPNGVTVIGNEAFYLCENLKSVTLPSTLEQIQDMAFMECTKLEQITIPDSVREIGQNAFNGCINLTSLTLGKGVELIEENAFISCTSLDYVNFPKSLRLLANDAFAGCTALTNIHYAGTIQEWNSVDSTGRDYGNTHVWYEGVPGEKITCTNGYIFISPISENEAYEAARDFLGIPKSQIGGIYEFVTKEKDQAHLDCYRVAYCEWRSGVGYMGQYEVLCEVYVNQYTGECEKVVYNYSDIPEVFLDVIFNREKFIFVDRYSNNETKECYLKTLELLPTCLFGAESQGYALLDIDGDSVPELIFSNSTLSSRGLILRYYDGKVYGYPWGGDILSDGTNSRHEGAGDVRVLDELYFDGLYLNSRELLRRDSSNPNNVKYYVEEKVTTKAEYDKFAAKYNGEHPIYTSLDLYPIFVNPFPGG